MTDLPEGGDVARAIAHYQEALTLAEEADIGSAWDGGWIYDPDKNTKHSVELTPIGMQSLKVVGYMGTKMLSQTMMWRRAPADLKRCSA